MKKICADLDAEMCESSPFYESDADGACVDAEWDGWGMGHCEDGVDDEEWGCGEWTWEDGGFCMGDINTDEFVNVQDIIHQVGFILAQETPTDYETWSADMNSDALINVLDVVIIVSCILGECESENDACSDMNEDDVTNVLDVILVINIILGETVQEQARDISWNIDWTLEQDPFEWGFLYFDANDDSYPEISKFLNNSVGLYDGTNEFSLIWGITDINYEYLNEMIDANNDDNKEGIFISSNIFSESTFNISSYNTLQNNPNWASNQEDGSLTLIDYADLDGDHFDEVIFGLNVYSVEDTAYTSQI